MNRGLVKYLPLMAFFASLQVQAADPLVVCVDAANPPFMSSVDGKAAGLYPALIASALRSAGVSAQLDARPWKRCIADIDAGTVAVGGIYKNEERLKKYDFSEQIFVEKMAVYFNKAHTLDFTGVDKLLGKRVGVVRGWSYGDDFDKAVKDGKITVEEVAADAQNFQKLAAGRIDAVLAIDEAGATLLKGGTIANVEKSPKYLFENPTFLAINKAAKQSEALTKFNSVIADMKKSGLLNKMATTELSK